MTLPRSFVRPLVRPMVRSGAVGPYGGATYQDGIHLNFASGNTTSGYYVKAVGAAPTVSPLTSLFTFTGGNQSMYMGPAGLLVASATNTPRIEYDASGNCRGLLMEAARTNLFLQSQTINTGANWVPTRASVSANATTSPDGTANAEKLVEDGTAANTHFVTQAVTFVSGTTYCISIWAKAGERSWLQLELGAAAFTSATSAYFDLTNGVVGTTANSPTTFMQQYPNGWWRVGIIKTATASSGANCNFYLATGDSGRSYNGDGASGLSLYGSQCEAGAFASSYIPTTTVAVSRTADSCIRTLGSEFSATAGTVVVAGRASGGQDAANNQFIYEVSDGTANERVILFRPAASDNARYNVVDGGVGQGPINDTLVNSTAFKHAATWATNDLATSFNGGAAQTDATATIPTMTTLYLGNTVSSLQMNGHILRFDYYPTRLPNTYLVSAST